MRRGGGDDAAERAGEPLLALTMALAISGALLHGSTSLWPPAIAPRLLSAGKPPAWHLHKRTLKMKWLETFAIVLVTPELNGLTIPVNLQGKWRVLKIHKFPRRLQESVPIRTRCERLSFVRRARAVLWQVC